jgi:hypothetical protein
MTHTRDTGSAVAVLTRDGLIVQELRGKTVAIAAYDEMLWKIRAGYAAVLYGTLTLVLGLGDRAALAVPLSTVRWIALLLVSGFTCCAALLDFAFLRCKYRVVQAKEELMDLALGLASDNPAVAPDTNRLRELLHNSGESRARIDWHRRPAVWPVAALYAITLLVGCVAALLLTSPAGQGAR